MRTHRIDSGHGRTLSHAILWGIAACALLLSACGPKRYRVSYQPLPVQVTIEKLPEKIAISERIQFRTGSADLLEASYAVLDEVAQAILGNDRIELVEVQGHTDSSGDYDGNVELSQERAQEVREYLIGKGVASGRLRAKGYGPDNPVADNDTAEGRRSNRRVEFVIANQDGQTTSEND